MDWNSLDWEALDRLRNTFLAGRPPGVSYWTSLTDLANYDFTYAQRIGWKWDAVIAELKLRGWSPPPGPLLDWGCGSGVAGRCLLDGFGPEHFSSLRVSDQSPLAMDFAEARAQERFPRLRVERGSGWGQTGAGQPCGTMVISHVLNELSESGGQALRRDLDQAGVILWVEPGTYADSRSLITMREALRDTFDLIAPCTHQAMCGMLTPDNERHWCHHFASPPPGIMADANWVRFAQRAGIDLRSIPYSFLVLERRGLRESVPGRLPEGWSRVIGKTRLYKGFAKIQSCQASGVCDLELQKRDEPRVFKDFENSQAGPVYRWEVEGRWIRRAEW